MQKDIEALTVSMACRRNTPGLAMVRTEQLLKCAGRPVQQNQTS